MEINNGEKICDHPVSTTPTITAATSVITEEGNITPAVCTFTNVEATITDARADDVNGQPLSLYSSSTSTTEPLLHKQHDEKNDAVNAVFNLIYTLE